MDVYANETISVKISSSNTTSGKNNDGEFLGITQNATIFNRENATAQWYVVINTSDPSVNFIPDAFYTVNIYGTGGGFDHVPEIAEYWSPPPQFYLHNGSYSVTTRTTQASPQTTTTPAEPIVPVIAIGLFIVLTGIKLRKK